MIYLFIFLLAFAALRFTVSAVNLIFPQVMGRKSDAGAELVSVLIPARNEERNISNILKSLHTQSYQKLEIVVYDDDSTDHTAEIILKCKKDDPRIKLIAGKTLPDGWLGKNHACHQLAMEAQGKYFLFLDADVSLTIGAIENAIAELKENELKLLSVFPKQLMLTLGEKLVIPMMNWILLSFLPLFLISKSKKNSLAAANGQFMLFEAETYRKYWFHEKVKNIPVEDIQIARLMKQELLKIQTYLSDEQVQCRMYTSYRTALNGFVKNVSEFFGGSKTIMSLFAFISTFGFIPFLLTGSFYLLMIYLLIVLMTRILVAIASRQSVLFNIILSIPQQISFLVVSILVLVNVYRKNYKWKGRNI